MNIELIVLIAMVVLALAYKPFVAPLLRANNIPESLVELFDFATRKAVLYAEQMYLTNQITQRKEIAVQVASDILSSFGVDPEKHRELIEKLIEAVVRELPKTNKSE